MFFCCDLWRSKKNLWFTTKRIAVYKLKHLFFNVFSNQFRPWSNQILTLLKQIGPDQNDRSKIIWTHRRTCMNKFFEKADPSKIIFSHRIWQSSHTFPPFLRNTIKCNQFLKLNYQQTNYFFPGTREEQAVSSLLKLVPVRLEYQHL